MHKVFLELSESNQVCMKPGDKTKTIINGVFESSNPYEIEEVYFRLCRLSLPGFVIVEPGDEMVTMGRFPTVTRVEGVSDRESMIWAMSEDGWRPPSGHIIKALIASADITQARAAEIVGVTLQTLQKWLSGKHKIHFGEWYTLMARIGMYA